MTNRELVPHLFRTEYRKIVSVLCRHFGFDQMEKAEDIASDTFLTATQTWGLDGIPENPVAWLYHVAKNKAKNQLQRDRLFSQQIVPGLQQQAPEPELPEIDLSPEHIRDSQLRMMFAVCHPAIPPEAQVGLSLRVLCGFSVGEIADAFLTTKETIAKRLYRAREKLRAAHIEIELPGAASIDGRLDTVLTTIYLLFNEGYYSVSRDQALRKELCGEAMRLCHMLTDHDRTNTPPVNALLALMCFHASRFDARTDGTGELILYAAQDTSRWNRELIGKGGHFLQAATRGDQLSRYHLEAGIAYWHTQPDDTPEKWPHILQLYDHLLQLAYSPVAALNRIYALSRVQGSASAIAEAEQLRITGYHFYFALLGELYSGMDKIKAKAYWQQALGMARTIADRQAIQKKIAAL